MSSSNAPSTPAFIDLALGLCWGAWTELGLAGWRRTHQDWAIDPEPLIVFTARLANDDPRLRDEALDWCLRYWRHVSKARLKNQPTVEINDTSNSWGEFAATVNRHSRAAWPHATDALTNYEPTGRSRLQALTAPSLACLRMRAMFGLGARTEILRELLFRPDVSMSVAQLARAVGYTKRNVADECENLSRAGVLKMRGESNRFYFSLAAPNALETFVGEIAPIRPDWNALFAVVGQLIAFDRQSASSPAPVAFVEMHTTLSSVQADLDALGLRGPSLTADPNSGEAFRRWAVELLEDLAAGRWPTA